MAQNSIGKVLSKVVGLRRKGGAENERRQQLPPAPNVHGPHSRGTESGSSGAVEPPQRSSRRPVDMNAYYRRCEICLETRTRSYFPMRPIAPGCCHPAGQVCHPCLGLALRAQLDGEMNRGFTCPVCSAGMFDRDAKTWASPEVYQRYQRLQERRRCDATPNFVWCSNSRCDSGQVHGQGPKSPIMTCRDCRAKTCFTHKCPWHEGLTCYEFDHPKRAMRTRQFANAGTKRQLHGLGQTSAKRLRGISRSNKATGEGSGALAERQAEEEREAEENRQKEEERRKEELLERRKEELKGEATAIRISKKCPTKGCGYRVEKHGGCGTIYCRCGKAWNWNKVRNG